MTAYVFGTDATALSGTNSIGPISFHNSGVGGSSAGTIQAGDFSAPGVATYDVTTIIQGLTAFDSVGFVRRFPVAVPARCSRLLARRLVGRAACRRQWRRFHPEP